jgi:AraC family ethanolamine operon transcriptional activator
MMIVAMPTTAIDRWVQVRRGIDRFDISLPLPHWQVPPADMTRRAGALADLLETLTAHPNDFLPGRGLSQIEAQVFEVILDMIPSAEVIEPLHSRARIARELLSILRERLDSPPTITELCMLVGAKERTLHLSCVEAFGRAPGTLLAELRLNAAHRALLHPDVGTSVAAVAVHFGFTHFGRFSSIYRRHFGELPSETLSRTRGG